VEAEHEHPDACPECGEITKSTGFARGVREETIENALCPNGHKLTRSAGGGARWHIDTRET
jgi:hypothetical protein